MTLYPNLGESNLQTKGGAKAIMLVDLGAQDRPLIGIWFDGFEWHPISWRRDGTYTNSDFTCDLDLAIIPVELVGDIA